MEPRKVITPLIRQHAADAAFYWQQIEGSQFSPVQKYSDIKAFHHLLHAHLDGLRAAGDKGWKEALASFKRWKTQGEAFVCALLAHESGDSSLLDAVWNIIQQTPSTTMKGYLTALAYLPASYVTACSQPLLQSSDALSLGVAIAASGHAGVVLTPDAISIGLSHEERFVKISTCQYLLQQHRQEYAGQLCALITDADTELACHAAVTAVGLAQDKTALFKPLFKLLDTLLKQPEKKGRAALLHNQWLEELVRICAHISLPRRDILSVINSFPDYLKVIFLAHYGRPEALPFLITLLSNEVLSRLAFWAISMITGIDTDDATLLALSANDYEVAVTSRAGVLSTGINRPDPKAVEATCQPWLTVNDTLLMGQPRTPETCKQYLMSGRQAARYTALWILSAQQPTKAALDNRTLHPVLEDLC